ncbi:MAG: hypothetical protein NTV73_13945 [Hyphomicrobiales bacterium]|nr:hypothetical protein [Hyphomicrobiales bacterium]
MSLHTPGPQASSRAGWFAMGALAASMAFVMLIVASDYVQALGTGSQVEAQVPALIIEAK